MTGKRPAGECAGLAMLTPGDIEAVREWIEAFGLRAVVVPDIGDSPDGHLTDAEYSALTLGGTPVPKSRSWANRQRPR